MFQQRAAEVYKFIPEHLRVSTIPASFWREIQITPFVVERIRRAALAQELLTNLKSSDETSQERTQDLDTFEVLVIDCNLFCIRSKIAGK